MWWDTVRALLAERRAIPVVLVCLPIVVLESRFDGPRGAFLSLSIFGGFLAIGPPSYRALFPVTARAERRLPRIAAFIAIAVVYLLAFGVALPELLGVEQSIFLDSITRYSALPFFWAGSWALGRDIEWEVHLGRAEARNAALAKEAERAQLLALRTHLDPHFLFNTLNAIAEWCREDPRVAERATLQLSAMLRTILTGVKASAWPLRDEVALVRQLLELHQTRDPDRFTFAIEIAEPALAIEVPPLVVLSLAENAVKHGPAAGHAGSIHLHAGIEGDCLVLAIQNPGPFGGPRDGADGLSTIEKRLKLAYDGAAEMRHESDGTTTTARVSVPLRARGDAV